MVIMEHALLHGIENTEEDALMLNVSARTTPVPERPIARPGFRQHCRASVAENVRRRVLWVRRSERGDLHKNDEANRECVPGFRTTL